MSSSCTLSVVSARTAPHLHGARCDHVDSVTADHVLVGHVSACRWPLVLLAKAERPSVERHTSLCDAAVRVSFRSLLVQRDQWDTYRGPKKVISCFAVRRGRGHRAAAPVESCQSLPKRSPWGRLGSALYTCNRLHRLRRRFKHFWPISLSSPRGFSNIRPILLPGPSESPRLLQRWRMRRRQLPDPRPIPEGVREPIYIRKK
jgi:hypothetical protein